MNVVIENIKNRRSTRRYKDAALPREVIDRIIEAGIFAPSSHNTQPWNFTIVTNKARIDALSEQIREWYGYITSIGKPFSFMQKVRKAVEEMRARVDSDKDLFFYHAPCVIIIHAKPQEFFQKDCACAAENMMLAARSLEVGSCWIGFADIVFNRSKKVRQSVGIPASHRVMATLIFGYAEKFPAQALPRKIAKKDWIE